MEKFGGEQYNAHDPEGNEKPEHKENSAEEIDAQIRELVVLLDNFDFEAMSPEIQEEWYWVEQEANVGKDRIAAKKHAEEFLNKLREESQNE